MSRTVSLVNLSKCSGSVTTAGRSVGHGFSENEDGLGSRIAAPNADLGKTHHGRLGGGRRSQHYMAYPAEAHQEDVVERGPIDDPTGDSGQPVPGTELPEAEEMEQEELDQFVLPGMTDADPVKAVAARYTFNQARSLSTFLKRRTRQANVFPSSRSCATARCSMSLSWPGQEEEPHRGVSARPNSRRAGLPGPAGLFASPVTAECITGGCSHRYSLRTWCT